MMSYNLEALKTLFGRYIDFSKWWHKAMDIGANEKAWLDKRKVTTIEQLRKERPWNLPFLQKTIKNFNQLEALNG